MAYDFRGLVARHSMPITVTEETGGYYDHNNGGKWTAITATWDTTAAVFNLSGRDVRGYAVQYGEGGSFTREDVRIHIHQELALGARITCRKGTFTVATQVDFSDHAQGLRIYVAKRSGERKFADATTTGGEPDYE
ncbi:MAG: hypothetical protein FWD98_06405 [Defluviitaleaceae bacterium]|nr:hypothetical protein [Defluviitaleaceae bacterium]